MVALTLLENLRDLSSGSQSMFDAPLFRHPLTLESPVAWLTLPVSELEPVL